VSARTIIRRFQTWQAGAALMLVGSGCMGAGLLVTTSAAPPADCPAGTTLVSKYKINNGAYTFEKPAGNDNVVVLSNTTAAEGDWTSTVPIVDMIVKAGPDSITTSFNPAVTSGHFDNLGFLVGSGQHPNLSDVEFCTPDTPVTTTTTVVAATTSTTHAVTTTTTSPAPTTTSPAPTTTTTSPAPTTTITSPAPTTTSTTAAPTTTTTLPIQEGSTTTVHVTVDETTTTTAPPATTTTAPAPGATTTTSVRTGSETAVVTTTSIGPASTSSGTLPHTGGQSAALIVIGFVFLVAGAAVTMLALQRRRTT
jgi:hypothetical protein